MLECTCRLQHTVQNTGIQLRMSVHLCNRPTRIGEQGNCGWCFKHLTLCPAPNLTPAILGCWSSNHIHVPVPIYTRVHTHTHPLTLISGGGAAMEAVNSPPGWGQRRVWGQARGGPDARAAGGSRCTPGTPGGWRQRAKKEQRVRMSTLSSATAAMSLRRKLAGTRRAQMARAGWAQNIFADTHGTKSPAGCN